MPGIEHKSPAQSCTLKTLARGGADAFAKACQVADTLRRGFDPAVIIISCHCPRKLFEDVGSLDGGMAVPCPEQPGVCTVHTSRRFQAMIIVTRELDYEKDYCKHGCEWCQWMSPDLTEEQIRALLRRQRNAAEKEKDVAERVTRMALLANLSVTGKLMEDNIMEESLQNQVYDALKPYWPRLEGSLRTQLAEVTKEKEDLEKQNTYLEEKLEEANRLLKASGLSPLS